MIVCLLVAKVMTLHTHWRALLGPPWALLAVVDAIGWWYELADPDVQAACRGGVLPSSPAEDCRAPVVLAAREWRLPTWSIH